MNLPNKLTVLRVLLIPIFVFFYLYRGIDQHYLWALVLFAAASFTDFLDGSIARKRGLVTDFGKLMDPLADKVLVMAAMICFITNDLVHPVIVIVILAREFLVTSIRLIAAGNGTVIAADIWGKAKTAVQMVWICYGLLLLSIANIVQSGLQNVLDWIYVGLVILVTLLTIISGLNYVIKNRQLFRDK